MRQVLALSHVRKSYTGETVLDDVTLGVAAGRDGRRGRAERDEQVHAAADVAGQTTRAPRTWTADWSCRCPASAGRQAARLRPG